MITGLLLAFVLIVGSLWLDRRERRRGRHLQMSREWRASRQTQQYIKRQGVR